MDKRKIITRSSLSMTDWLNMVHVMQQAYLMDNRVPRSDAEIEVWYKFLRGFPAKIVDIAVCDCVATGKRPPLIADIVEKCEERLRSEARGCEWLRDKYGALLIHWPDPEEGCERLFWDICTGDKEVPDMEKANWIAYRIANAADAEIHHEGGLKDWLMKQKEQMK